MSSFSVLSFYAVGLMGTLLLGQDSQTITLNQKLQIPGATLKPGEYTFAVEDRLADRAIIRITNPKKNTHELLLAVPNDKLNSSERGKLLFFPVVGSDKQILQGWMCSNCQSALQVVYPKAEAVKITGESAKPVMAVDPTYDKLPKNLSPDDMKVVTLWLLSPKEITPEQKGKGVEAAKYTDIRNSQNTQVAAASQSTVNVPTTDTETKTALARATAPPLPGARATTNSNNDTKSVGADSASAVASPPSPSSADNSASALAAAPAKAPNAPAATDRQPLMDDRTPAVAPADTKPAAVTKNSTAPNEVARTRRMPHTASNTYNFGLAGLALLSLGVVLHLQRRFSWVFFKAVRRK